MLVDIDKDTEGNERAVDRLLKRRRRLEVSTTVKMCSKEAQSVQALASPSTRVEAREMISSSVDEITKLTWIGLKVESRKKSFKVFMDSSLVISSNVEGLEIPYTHTEEAIL